MLHDECWSWSWKKYWYWSWEKSLSLGLEKSLVYIRGVCCCIDAMARLTSREWVAAAVNTNETTTEPMKTLNATQPVTGYSLLGFLLFCHTLVSVAHWHSARWAWNSYQPGLGSIPRPGRINCFRITGVHALRLISRTGKRVRRCPLFSVTVKWLWCDCGG